MNLQKTNNSEIEKPPLRLNTDAIDALRASKLTQWFPQLSHAFSRAIAHLAWSTPR